MMMVIAITEKGEKKMPFIDEDRLYENRENRRRARQRRHVLYANRRRIR